MHLEWCFKDYFRDAASQRGFKCDAEKYTMEERERRTKHHHNALHSYS